MRPVIYIDMLFLMNFMMNTLTLYTASLFLRRGISVFRLLLAVSVLALYSCMVFFPQIGFMYSILAKALILTCASFIAFPAKHWLTAIKNAIVFFVVSAIYAGIAFALIFATDFGTRVGASVSNGEIYLDIKASTLMKSAVISYICVYAVSYVKKATAIQSENIFDIKIGSGEKSISIKAFGDTGCGLCDPINDIPAIIITKAAAKKLLSHSVLRIVEGKGSAEEIRKCGIKPCVLPFSSIDNKKGVLYGFLPDEVFVNKTEVKNCIIAISDGPMCNNGEFDAIFNPLILNQRKDAYV